MLRRSSKFYSKSLTLFIGILEMVKVGKIAADIAKDLGMPKSHVFYYLKKGREMGYLKQVMRDAFSSVELTQAGKNLLDQYTNNNMSVPICRCENLQFKAVITKMPVIPVDWKKVEMHHWTQYITQIDGIKIKLNTGNPPTLLLLPSPIEGENPNDLIVTLVYVCVNLILELSDKFGLELGKLQPCSRPEWLVYDPVARALCKNNGQITYEGIGKVNASPPRSIGELEFQDPMMLIDYILMPKRVERIEKMIEQSQCDEEYCRGQTHVSVIDPLIPVYCSTYGSLVPLLVL